MTLSLRILRQSFERWALEQQRRFEAGEITSTPPFPVVLREDVGARLFRAMTQGAEWRD
jgi:hypothetical protein